MRGWARDAERTRPRVGDSGSVVRHASLSRVGTATAQVGPEVALDPSGDAAAHGVRLSGLCEEGLEVLLDQRIERRLSGTAPAVDGAHSLVHWAGAASLIESRPVYAGDVGCIPDGE